MKFDGAPVQYDTPFHSPGIGCPMEEHDEDIKIEEILISSGYGIYIPQMFTELFEKKDEVPQLAWNTCKKGPDSEDDSYGKNYDYWDAWTEILDRWEYFSYEGNGCTYKYFLQHDGDLCLMRQFISQELD